MSRGFYSKAFVDVRIYIYIYIFVFFFFLLGEAEGGVRGAGRGGGVDLLLKIPGGRVSRRGGAEGPEGCLQRIGELGGGV